MMSIVSSLPRPVVKVVVGVWRRRWLVLLLAWIVAVAGWFATTTIPDTYESRAQVYINTQTALDTTIAEVGSRPNLEKQVRIIRTQLLSRDNIERLVYEIGLDAGVSTPVELERLIKGITRDIKVESDEDQYFTIRYGNEDPVLAQRVVSAVLDLFIEQNLSSAIADVDTAIANLDREITERKANLDEVTSRIAAFRRDNSGELAGSERTARRLESKEEELVRIEEQTAIVERRRQRILGSLASTPRYSPGSNLDSLKLQLATLQSQYNDSYPDIQRLKAQIAELESGSSTLPQNPEYVELSASARNAAEELATLRARATRVQIEVDDLSLRVTQTPEAESKLVDLFRDQEQVEKTYKALIKQRTEMDVFANLNEAGGAIQYRRFEAPIVAAEPSWPPRGWMTLGILFVALGAGGVVAFVLSQLDKTYTQALDLEAAFGLPVLGEISQSSTKSHFMSVLLDRLGMAACLGALFLTAGALWWFYEERVSGDAGNEQEVAALVQPTERGRIR